jgi:RNase P/RNase MRP subunit p29
MSFRKSLLIGVAILALAVSISAQSSTAGTETVTGTVVSSGPAVVVIDTDAGRQTFVVDTDSTVPSNLVAGSRVTVNFNRLSDDRMHAATVALLGTEPISSDATTAPPSMGPTQTVTGTVISSGNGQLVVDTPSGQRTFIVDDDSHLASDVTVGSRASVAYHTLSSGRLHAGDVTLMMAAQPQATTPMAAAPAPAPAPMRTASALPQTASDLPLVGLVGLIALAGAVGVRVVRHTD